MKTVEKLLAIFIAVTLALSVVSVADPSYLTGGFNAYADDQEDTESNSDHGSNTDHDSDEQEHDEDECNNDEHEATDEQENEDASDHEEETSQDDQSKDESSEDVTEEESTEDKTHEQEDVNEDEETAEEQNEAEAAGEGVADEEQEDNDVDEQEEENDVEDEDEGCNEEEDGQESKIKWELEDTGIEVKVDLKGINMTDGSYDVVFSCTEPAISENFAGAFNVDDGEGEFEVEISLPNGTYNGCELTIQDETITQIDSFTVVGEVDEDVKESRKERRHSIVNSITGTEIHNRHLNAEPASTGDYQPGWSYSLVAAGTAEGDDNVMADAAIDLELAVWKSNRAAILMDVVGGQVEIGNNSYTIAIGYALYSTHSDMLRINALVIDDATGDVLKMKMRGSAITEDAEFPTDAGTLDLEFEGNSGPSKNEVDGWELMLAGTVAAEA